MRSFKQSLTIIMSTNDFMYFRLMVNIMPSGESGIADRKNNLSYVHVIITMQFAPLTSLEVGLVCINILSLP